MTELIIIAAVAENGVIGRKNDIPWRIAEDFKRFKRMTLSYPCIMGDATFASLPDASRPLPDRENVVLSLDPAYHAEGVTIFHDFDSAISHVRAQGLSKAFITGGATIYRLGLKVADTLELTRVHRVYEGDVYFPEFDARDWARVFEETHEGFERVSNGLLRFTYETYRRRT
jgi:dihydrofolate reductase